MSQLASSITWTVMMVMEKGVADDVTDAEEMSEDDSRRAQDEIQKIVDKVIADVDSAAAAKEKEMMEV